MNVSSLLSSLTTFIDELILRLYMYVCTACLCMICDSVYLSTNVPTEALYEKKQSIVTFDPEVAKLQAHVEKLESASAEKESDYEAIVKRSEGEVI